MSLIAWIILGLISGFIASQIVNSRGEGFFGDPLAGERDGSIRFSSANTSRQKLYLATLPLEHLDDRTVVPIRRYDSRLPL